MAIHSASSPSASAFLAFDRKTGFQARVLPAPQAQTPPVQRSLRLSLFEAAFGCTRRMSAMESVRCPRCAGSGLPHVSPCPVCQGRGKTERRAWEADVTIHAGTLDGMEVAASDVHMLSSTHSPAPSLRFLVQIERHPLFRLDRDRLSITVPVSVWRWVQGGAITVPTLQGSASVTLPNRPAAMLVPQQGWPEPGQPERRKPLYVLPRLVFPEHLRHADRRMLELLDLHSDMPEVTRWGHHLKAWVESPSTDFD